MVQEVAEPVPRRPDDVLVRVRAAALNRLDLWVIDGLPKVPPGFPHILGSDAAGVVEAAEPASGFRAGDRVLLNPGQSCGHCEHCLAGEQPLCREFGVVGEHLPGTFAERLVAPAANLARVPDGLGWVEAAALPLVTLTAWRMLVTRARLRHGETVLIWGIGGGVAQAALAVARLAGATTIVTSGSDDKLARARALGADHLINHSAADVVQEVRRLTGRRGVDVVVETVGQETWERSLRSLGRGGRVVVSGATSGPQCTTDARRLFWNQWSILGSTMGSHAEFRAVVEAAGRGHLRPVVDRVFTLEEGPVALAYLALGNQFGKVVLEVNP